MSSILNVRLSQGYVSGKDAYDIDQGELTAMTGAYYKKHDASRPWKMPGRSLFGATSGTEVLGLAICQFDEGGTDKLLAMISTKIQAATPGTTGTFADLITGLNASANVLTACHQDDRWYLGNGYDKNKVLMPNGTTRDMGLPTPQLKLTAATSSTAGTRLRPTFDTGGFTNPTFAYDTSVTDTYASGTLTAAGTITHTWNTWVPDATAGRVLQLRWSLSGLPINNDAGSFDGTVGTGGTLDAGYNVTYLLEKSEDGGTVWSTVYTETRTNASPGVYSMGPTVTANSSLLQFRATLTYNSGTNPATLRIWDIYTLTGSTVTPFDTAGSMYYAYVWVNSNDANSNGALQGAPSDTVEVVAFTGKTYVTLTRSETAPTDATHWAIYRTAPDAADTIDNLGRLALVPVAQTTYNDTFLDDVGGFLDPTIQLTPVMPALTVGDLSIPRDTQPPSFLNMTSWNGSVCGFSRTNRRAWRYSAPGLPESFPEFYVVSSFPLPEHDGLVGQMPVGQSMVLLCEGACLVVDETPTVVDGQFNGSNAKPLSGHPGCVGEYAYTSFSVSGEPRGAWVSPFGVYVTNGSTCACISTDLSWEEEVNVPFLSSSVLRWDQKNLILWFEFDSDGDGNNDREMPFHMAPVHEKGQYRPKIGQPTEKATSCMTSALISSSHYRFSGHPDDGSVYIEEVGAEDDSTSSVISTLIRTGKITQQKVTMALIKGTLVHSDFGDSEHAVVTTTVYRDSAISTSTRTATVSLEGDRGVTFGIARAGEAIQFEISHESEGQGAFLGFQVEYDGEGRTGSAPRWVGSASATP